MGIGAYNQNSRYPDCIWILGGASDGMYIFLISLFSNWFFLSICIRLLTFFCVVIVIVY